jgi:phosphatidylinositol glycan class M
MAFLTFLQDIVASRLFLLALLFRLALLCWSVYQDGSLAVQYTDLDYRVFNDAAAAVLAGGSPYSRATYRYPPLFAWLLVPGHWLGCPALWGKALFVLGDLAVGGLQVSVLQGQGLPRRAARLAAALFLLSPIAAVTSTRGSADSLACALCLAALASLLRGRLALAGAALGLATHLRLYPIIYALPCALHLALRGPGQGAAVSWLPQALRRLLAFGAPAAAALLLPTAAAYALYGQDAISEAYLHHASRLDTRHNFSPLWLPLHMGQQQQQQQQGASWAAATPLALLAATLVGALAWRHLPACLFLQTLAFTALNRVLTAQYFSWWMALLPLLAARTAMPPAAAAACAALWLAAQLHWLAWAFELELGGEAVHQQVHHASLALAAAHAVLGGAVAGYHQW